MADLLFSEVAEAIAERERLDRQAEGAVVRAERWIRAVRLASIELAKSLDVIDRTRQFTEEGCSSVLQYAVLRGISPRDAREYVWIAQAMKTYSDLESDLRSGRKSLETAAVLGRLAVAAAEFQLDRERWMRLAAENDPQRLRQLSDEWLAEQREGQPTVTLTFNVRSGTALAFRRCQVLASRKANQALTADRTFRVIVDAYREQNEPLYGQPRERRLPDTGMLPLDRYIAAEVRRKILVETDDCCQVPGCQNKVFLHFSHVVAHARGGDRERKNLMRLCSIHNWMMELGLLKVEGTAEAPVFLDAAGKIVDAKIDVDAWTDWTLGDFLEPGLGPYDGEGFWNAWPDPPDEKHALRPIEGLRSVGLDDDP